MSHIVKMLNLQRSAYIAVFLFITFSCVLSLPFVEQKSNAAVCGYKMCDLGIEGRLNVHLVPHTHDDVGWLKTVDQYFYGARNDIQTAGVQYIIDSVVSELQHDPNKRFIYVEMAFFNRWWHEQDDTVKHTVRRLVNEGRLEFILGGWCMNDEAAAHYNAIIDQHTVGFKFLKDTFGDCAIPRIGWQIDPFGHSREQASLFAQFGFDGLFFGRLDYQDKDKRLKDKTMELMWLASQNLGDQATLFTGVNYNGYSPPDNFCFDAGCDDAPIMDDARLEDYNVDQKVQDFIKAVKTQAANYSTSHIMLTMGSDFQFSNAHKNFKNIDKLIKYVNQVTDSSGVNVFYSTPSCYLYALNSINQTYTSKSDDFFPYASSPHTFWTGYFTSRPALKRYVRESNNFLQVCKQLDVLADISEKFSTRTDIDQLRQAMGVVQHHDAVSGTSKQAVAYDYAKRLAGGNNACQYVVSKAISELMPLQPSTAGIDQSFCPLLNVSFCPSTDGGVSFTVTVYNPVGRPRMHYIRLPVGSGTYQVFGPDQKPVPVQVIPISPETQNIPEFNGSRAKVELVFSTDLPALGFTTYFVTRTTDIAAIGQGRSTIIRTLKDTMLKNEYLALAFDGSSGLLSSVTILSSAQTVAVKQSLMYYKAFAGNNSEPQFQSSGAYAFRPNGSSPMSFTDKVKVTLVQGDLVQEVHQVFGDWASQVFRLYKGSPFVEIEWTVGPIAIQDGIGKEVISRFETDLKTDATFYTDANGRELLKRVRNFRPTWNLNQTEEVAGNYFPVNSRIAIVDKTKDIQLSVLTDRSQGGASIKDGQLELMIHRRLLYDDSFGVGEPLNETGISGKGLVVRGKQYLCLNSTAMSNFLHRELGNKLFMSPVAMFAPLKGKISDYASNYKTQWSGMQKALPFNVHLLTLEEFTADTFLFRLENFYEENETGSLPSVASVSLKDLFSPFTVGNVTELTLGANQELQKAKRLQWNVQGYGRTKADMKSFVKPVDPTDLTVILKPMQIRTFQVQLQYHH